MAELELIPYRIRIGVTGHRELEDPAPAGEGTLSS
jgi:hypothetical protein